MICDVCGSVYNEKMGHTCNVCSYCGDKFPSGTVEEHEKCCIEKIFTVCNIEAEQYIYVFVFVYDEKQHYYVGRTENPEQRLKEHAYRRPKTIYTNGGKEVAPKDDIKPLNAHIVETADSIDEADAKERKVFIDLVRKIPDEEMVLGGK